MPLSCKRHSPQTKKVWLELLNQTDVAMAGQSTHLGDAIGLAIKVFEQSDKSRGALEQDQNREKSRDCINRW